MSQGKPIKITVKGANLDDVNIQELVQKQLAAAGKTNMKVKSINIKKADPPPRVMTPVDVSGNNARSQSRGTSRSSTSTVHPHQVEIKPVLSVQTTTSNQDTNIQPSYNSVQPSNGGVQPVTTVAQPTIAQPSAKPTAVVHPTQQARPATSKQTTLTNHNVRLNNSEIVNTNDTSALVEDYGVRASGYKVPDNIRGNNKENKTTVKSGLAVAAIHLQKPFGDKTDLIFNIKDQSIFVINLIASLVDLIIEPLWLHYKVTCFVLGIIETVLQATIFFSSKLTFLQGKIGSLQNRLGLYQNILHEVLLYPMIVCNIFGIVAQKSYEPESAMDYIGIILLSFDIFDLLFTYIVRMVLAYKLLDDLRLTIPMTKENEGRITWLGGIFPRLYWTLVGNTIFFTMMMIMLSLQIHQVNYIDEDFRATWDVWFMILITVVLPVLSIFLFVFINSFWVNEAMIYIARHVANNTEFRDNLEEEYADITKESVSFIVKNTVATDSRLQNIRDASLTQKIFHASDDPFSIVLIIIWIGLVVTFGIIFQPYTTVNEVGLTMLYFFIAFLVNFQLFSFVFVIIVSFCHWLFTCCYGCNSYSYSNRS
ncbi:unnamed protein product [Owenia fusiformis]|uniref:Transmembrane protein n=1 Tax=Owenia fusiformis TaxID=6347 RepID=A0A8S4PD43_OWEFU|nr:unnamed protein product [Owenia fusiformis]